MAHEQLSLVNFIMSRQSKLETDKSPYNDGLQDVADFVSPHRSDILGTETRGERRGTKIYDGTAVGAAVLATNGIHGYHVSPAFAWFKYTMSRKGIGKNIEVKKWLGEIEYNMYMALNQSNYYAEMWPFIYDGFTLGTAAIYPEEDLATGKIVFETIHPGEIFIAENKYGEVDVLHRKRKLTARKMEQMFGLDALPDSIKQAVNNAPFSEFEVIHAVYPREEYNSRLKDAKNKKFASVWIATGGNEGNKELRVSGFDEFPYHVWRYIKTGKEVYGTSPSHLAMADIKGLQLMSKTLLGAAQMHLQPSLNVPSYMEGKVKMTPNGQNFLKPGDTITPINSSGNFPVGIDREQNKRDMIEKRFHVDTFLLLTRLAGQGQRTAFEVSEMMAERATVAGAELGPFNVTNSRLLDHVYNILTDAGKMPAPPDILLEMVEEDPTIRFDPIYQGPLAQAQREKFGKDPIRKFFADIAPLVEVEPEILDNFDLDEAARALANINAIPGEIMVEKDVVAKRREGRAQAQAEEAQQEQIEQTLAGAETLSKVDKNLEGGLQEAVGGAPQ